MGKHMRRGPLGNHKVGYCRTPEETRFPNQHRRAPATKQPRTVAMRQTMADFFGALETKVTVTRDGKRRRLPAGQVIFEQLVTKAVKGEAWALRRAIDLQLALTREYEADLNGIGQSLLDLEDMEKAVGPLPPAGAKLKAEMQRRLSDPRELFDINGPQRRRR